MGFCLGQPASWRHSTRISQDRNAFCHLTCTCSLVCQNFTWHFKIRNSFIKMILQLLKRWRHHQAILWARLKCHNFDIFIFWIFFSCTNFIFTSQLSYNANLDRVCAAVAPLFLSTSCVKMPRFGACECYYYCEFQITGCDMTHLATLINPLCFVFCRKIGSDPIYHQDVLQFNDDSDPGPRLRHDMG